MSNYPDGMTSKDWENIDGGEHHQDCPQHPDYLRPLSDIRCLKDNWEDVDIYCECDTLYPSKEDIELERLGL